MSHAIARVVKSLLMKVREKLHTGRGFALLSRRCIALCLLGLLCPLASSEAGHVLYVAPTGDDSHSGDRERPLATLVGARDAVAAILADEGHPEGGGTVLFAGGVYPITQRVTFGAQHAGTADAPIVFRAQEGHEPQFSGAVTLDPSDFRPVTDRDVLERIPEEARDHVRVLNLSDYGIDPGQHFARGHSIHFKSWLPRGPETPELIFNHQPLTLARWPNEGFTQFAEIIDAGSRPPRGSRPEDHEDYRLPVLGYDDPRMDRWATATDAWLHGYWGNEWSDQTIPIKSVVPEDRTIALKHTSSYGINREHRYFVFNLLEELELPGEWYLDRQNMKLYLYPPAAMEDAEILLTQLTEPLVELNDTAHLVFRGLTFEGGRGAAIVVNNSNDNLIDGCRVRHFAGDGIVIRNGKRNQILSTHIHSIGARGISVSGGDTEHLIAAEHIVKNCHIHDFSRIRRTYTPAIRVGGVGQRIAHNEIHDAPHMGLSYSGNNHVFEYNVVYDIAKETGDVGGIYTGRSWVSRGTVIRYNLFHSVAGLEGGHGAFPVYFDDGMSAALVKGNIIHGTHGRAVLIGGGHHIEVVNNLFLECETPVGLDARLLNWGDHHVPNLKRRLAEVVNRPAWLAAYPELADILTREPHPSVPHNNVIKNNLFYRSGDIRVADEARPYTVIENNLETDRDPGFADPATFDFSFPEDSWLYEEIPGFEPIPFHKIGRFQYGH